MSEIVDTTGATNNRQGVPTLNGNADLGWFGAISQLATQGLAAYKTIKGTGTTDKATTAANGSPLNTMTSKTMIYIGAGIAVLIVVLMLLRRK